MDINFTLVMQAIAFAVFVWLTAKFLWPPLMGAIENRQKQIAEGQQREAGKQSLANTRSASPRCWRRASDIIAQGEAQDQRLGGERRASAEAKRIIDAAHAEIDRK
jgi:F-type H+-transporting ATPase subunit b